MVTYIQINLVYVLPIMEFVETAKMIQKCFQRFLYLRQLNKPVTERRGVLIFLV